ncbi:MAG TPA: DUF6188 family protein [Gryllotalpicola sp.]
MSARRARPGRQDLGLTGLAVYSVEFRPDTLYLWFDRGIAYLEVGGLIGLRLPDGTSADYDASSSGTSPTTPALLNGLVGAAVVDATAGEHPAILDVEFDSGLRLHYEPTSGPYEEWEAKDAAGTAYVCLPNNRLTVWQSGAGS